MLLLRLGILVVLIVIIFILFRQRVQEKITSWLEFDSHRVLWLPAFLGGCYFLYRDSPPDADTLLVSYYFMTPTMLAALAYRYRNNLVVAAILAIWLPIDFRWVIVRWGDNLLESSWLFVVLGATVTTIVLWACLLRPGNLHINYAVNKSDATVTSLTFIILACILVPLAIMSGFAELRGSILQNPISSLCPGLPGSIIVLIWLGLQIFGIGLCVALPEELLFRALIQNYLQKIIVRPRTALLLASIIFGAAHLNNYDHSLGLGPSHWNWMYMGLASIAGAGYGFVYQQTKSLWCPILLHASVDTVWHTFFQ